MEDESSKEAPDHNSAKVLEQLKIRKLEIEIERIEKDLNSPKESPKILYKYVFPALLQVAAAFLGLAIIYVTAYKDTQRDIQDAQTKLLEAQSSLQEEKNLRIESRREQLEAEKKEVANSLSSMKDSLTDMNSSVLKLEKAINVEQAKNISLKELQTNLGQEIESVQAKNISLMELQENLGHEIESEQAKNNSLKELQASLNKEIEYKRKFAKWGFALELINERVDLNHPKVIELIEHVQSNGEFRSPILDSLYAMIKRTNGHEYPLSLMYLATKDGRWRKSLLDQLGNRIQWLDSGQHLAWFNIYPYTSIYNSLADKYDYSVIIIDGLLRNTKVINSDRAFLLNQVRFYSSDSLFKLHQFNYSLFSTYIWENEFLIRTADVGFSIIDPLVNIGSACPQSYMRIMTTTLSKASDFKDSDFGLSEQQARMIIDITVVAMNEQWYFHKNVLNKMGKLYAQIGIRGVGKQPKDKVKSINQRLVFWDRLLSEPIKIKNVVIEKLENVRI